MRQPNILLIHVDQHRYDCLGVNGHPAAVTPHLDRLAAEGVNFTHACCPIPICMPARTSLLTGVYATQHGCLANRGTEGYRPMDPQLATFSQVLKAGGYWLGYVGKWEVGTAAAPQEFGFDAYVPDKGYLAWRREQGLPALPTRNGWFGEVDPGVTPDQTALGWGADHVMRLLREAAGRDQPFFLRWDPNEPHLPNVLPEPFASLVAPADVPPWPSFPDPLLGKPFIQRQQVRTWGLEGWRWQDWAPIVARYLGEVALIDHQVGRILADAGPARPARADAGGLHQRPWRPLWRPRHDRQTLCHVRRRRAGPLVAALAGPAARLAGRWMPLSRRRWIWP